MSARTDEGMWLLSDPPRALLREKHGFDLGDDWLRTAMRASVRFNNGGSGGFVSPSGLIVTNHHIAADALQKLGTAERDLYRDGFLARTVEDELKCPDLELNVLQEIVDVTERVNAAVTPAMGGAEAAAARRAAMSAIEKESLDQTGLRSDVVTLYQGGLYHLYRYKKYTDVRLVFAPEQAIAFFGGDTDNFEYPRFNLDVAFFRVYENGQPANTPDYFRWAARGPDEGDLAFVVGHPGTTNRLETLAKLRHRRDVSLPYTLGRLRMLEAAIEQFSALGAEERRRAATDLHRVANGRKALSGQLQGLLNPAILQQKKDQEESLIKEFKSIPERPAGDPWQTIADAQRTLAEFEKPLALFDRGDAFGSELFTIARHLVRLADELPKDSTARLREYRDSNLDSLKFQLFSPAPIYPDLERAKLKASLTWMAETLGGDHPQVVAVLGGLNPEQRASELVANTKLFDAAARKALHEAGRDAIATSDDAMIQLARTIDAAARELRKRYEENVEEPERRAYADIAALRFKIFGSSVAPDATFTLRLAFGTVSGYEVDGKTLPFHTTFGGAFEKAESFRHQSPNELPKRWMDRKAALDLTTPFNFTSTSDTIGGNSGSPVLNRAGEVIGVNFDRNRHGLVRNFVYTDVQARHIAVHAAAVLLALRKIYDAEALASELTAR